MAGGISGLIRRVLAATPVPVRPGIQQIVGPVAINGERARAGMQVNPGDTIATGNGAQAIYVIGADAYLQRADSQVSFGAGTIVPILRILAGRLLSVFGSGRRDIFIPGAMIGIRGTGCYVEADLRRSYFCLCYGSALLKPAHGTTLEYATRHHDRPLWIEDGAIVSAPVIDHTDAELAMLEALVGRQPPFYATGAGPY
jgi:hypothetical protein